MEEEAIIYNRLIRIKDDIEDIIQKLEDLGYKTDHLKTARNTVTFTFEKLKKDYLSKI